MQKIRDILLKVTAIPTLIFLYFFVLLLFGRQFSKFQLAEHLYLHDVVLGLITLFVFFRFQKIRIHFTSTFIVILISIVYFLFSVINKFNDIEVLLLTFRQFHLFVYLICSFFLFNQLVRNTEHLNKVITLIRYISFASILLQILFIIYGFLFISSFSLFAPDDYNYFSPLVVFGIIVFGGIVLSSKDNNVFKFLKFLLILFLSTTVGHASAFFALLVMLITYFLLIIKPVQRLIGSVLFIILLIYSFNFSGYSDVNLSWRLLYWEHVLHKLTTERFLLFGYGFGEPYMTAGYADYLLKELNSPLMTDAFAPNIRYLSPPHNSFITIAFHIGLLPLVLLLVPLVNCFRYLFFKKKPRNTNLNFLIMSLVGCMVWVSFNVILELPHSATFFWLIFFTTAYAFKYEQEFSSPVRKMDDISTTE